MKLDIELTKEEYAVLTNALEDYRDNMQDQVEWVSSERKPWYKDQGEIADRLVNAIKDKIV